MNSVTFVMIDFHKVHLLLGVNLLVLVTLLVPIVATTFHFSPYSLKYLILFPIVAIFLSLWFLPSKLLQNRNFHYQKI